MKSHFHPMITPRIVDSFGSSQKSVRKQGKIERSEKRTANLCSGQWAWVQ